jgi:hypothetical protein
MSGISKKLMGTTAAGGEALAIEDVFSTYLYTGNGSTQTITNDIDLAGEGGLVWIKRRNGAYSHVLYDTDRGVNLSLSSNTTSGNVNQAPDGVSAFEATGFSLNGNSHLDNNTTGTFASWTFRKAPRFFDCVEYTGDGTDGRQITHSLGQSVGACIIKRTDSTGDWPVWHRSGGYNGSSHLHGVLNYTDAFANYGYFNTSLDQSTYFTSTYFTVESQSSVNASGGTYIAYLFAHDPLGPSEDGSDGLIACGSYTGNGSTVANPVTLGWEPQWLLIKQANASGNNWVLFDVMRGIATGGDDNYLYPNTSGAEGTVDRLSVTPTGFSLNSLGSDTNANGDNYIYIAIRRGPMRAPTSGTEVFDVEYHDATVAPAFKSPFPVDFALVRNVTATTSVEAASRLTQGKSLSTASTAAETSDASYLFDYQDGWRNTTGTFTNLYSWMFRRAPGFFDVVAYSGNSVAGRTVPHNLGVAPEMMIVKSRTDANSWYVYTQPTGNTGLLVLNSTTAAITPVSSWNNTSPTNVVFSVDNSSSLNGSGITYIAYLFATLPGVSKVGSFTHTINVDTNVDCGFTSGARFVLIKRTDSTGDWYVFDTARGIESGSDKALFLNNTSAEQTADWLDPSSTGFIVDGPNWSSGTYIFYAIA